MTPIQELNQIASRATILTLRALAGTSTDDLLGYCVEHLSDTDLGRLEETFTALSEVVFLAQKYREREQNVFVEVGA